MDNELLLQGYKLDPTHYTPRIGFSRLRVLIPSSPSKHFFDCKRIRLPTFDNHFFHDTQISRHEAEPRESFQVVVGRFRLESYQGNDLNGFSFGGEAQVSIVSGELFCDFTSTAPVIMLNSDPVAINNLLVDEIIEMLAEKKARLSGHEDELYTRLARCDAHMVFLGCLASLRARFDSVPNNLRKGNFPKAFAQMEKVIQIVRKADNWDGRSPTLDELLSG